MLTEISVEALLVDADLANQVWNKWNSGEADNQAARIAWKRIARVCSSYDQHEDNRKA